MKKIYAFLLFFAVIVLGSCQNEEDSLENVGYLRLAIGADHSTITKAGEEVYNPKQLAVKIVNQSGGTVEQTDDYTTWENKVFALSPGRYIIQASSKGFDGKTTGWDKPYYAGADTVLIEKDKSVSSEFACTLANVLVTVEFDDAFKKAFKSATVVVTDTTNAANRLTFRMGDDSEKGKGYFPVAGLFADISVTNQKDKSNSKIDTVKNVYARENVILKYHLAESNTGSTNIKIELDGSTKTYIYDIGVATTAQTVMTASAANAWSNFAYLQGKASVVGVLDKSKLAFEYKEKDAGEWTKVSDMTSDAEDSNLFTAKVTGLDPATQYEYRLVYGEGEEAVVSDAIDFTTEEATLLPNGNLDDWYKDGKTWDAISETDFKAEKFFWDSSNPGTTTGAGAIVNKNPTQGVSSPVHTAGGRSAELKSQFASAFGIGKFAAASLYSGAFNDLVGTKGAKIDFGREFSSRPTQLKGWFQYTNGKINYVGDNLPGSAGVIKDKTDDLWSAYVVLTTGSYTLDNTNMSGTAKDFAALLQDDKDSFVVAYGALPDEECVPSSEWKQFSVNLTYKNLIQKPTHIIIVFSSSKYGDYFTGSTSSVLYLDDLELIYGEPTVK